MKKLITIILCFLLIIPCAHAEKSLGISRQEFLGRLFEASFDSDSGHYPSPQIYSCTKETDHYLYFLSYSENLVMQITCPIIGDEIYNILVAVVGGNANDAWDFMLLMTEIANALGVVSFVSPGLSVSQDNFLKNIGFTSENPIIDGQINSYTKGGNVYWWQYIKDHGAFVFCVEPE